ncbi:MAG: Uma2 family endonuclease [Pyrinomonadaceae bacterium]
MAANPKDLTGHYFSLDEYFALEQVSDARFEYWDGAIVCMSGGSQQHGQISSNVHYRLRRGLEGGGCRAFTGDQCVKTPTLPPYRYPDASAACGEIKYQHIHGVDALVNPVLIVEVLSPTTATLDQGEKFAAYQAIETFAEYLLVAQDAPRVTLYTRQPGGAWTRRDVIDTDADLPLESVGCALRMRDIYEGVSFPV